MVTDTAEVLAVRNLVDEILNDLGIRERVELGAMIETPAAALMAAGLLREVDFLSIGSNDLTQYTLAMDRGHPQLAGRTDALHPAVLKLIATTAEAGAAAAKLIAVCGAMASDRAAVPILLGLGVRELSVVPAAVPAIKRQIRALRIDDCRELAARCLELGSPAQVRARVRRQSPLSGRRTLKLRFDGLQQLGRALMLPIAVLPIAGLLLRVGQPDLLGWAAMAAAGDAIFSNLGLLFAVGVGVGLARENHGAAGLAAVVGYLVTIRAVETMLHAAPGSLAKLSIPVGLLSGVIAGVAYNRYSNITLPSYLSFFGGRRFVPIVSGLAGLRTGRRWWAMRGHSWSGAWTPPVKPSWAPDHSVFSPMAS